MLSPIFLTHSSLFVSSHNWERRSHLSVYLSGLFARWTKGGRFSWCKSIVQALSFSEGKWTLFVSKDLINWGWKYSIGVGLFKKGVTDKFLDYVFQGYHFYINSRSNFYVKIVSYIETWFFFLSLQLYRRKSF